MAKMTETKNEISVAKVREIVLDALKTHFRFTYLEFDEGKKITDFMPYQVRGIVMQIRGNDFALLVKGEVNESTSKRVVFVNEIEATSYSNVFLPKIKIVNTSFHKWSQPSLQIFIADEIKGEQYWKLAEIVESKDLTKRFIGFSKNVFECVERHLKEVNDESKSAAVNK